MWLLGSMDPLAKLTFPSWQAVLGWGSMLRLVTSIQNALGFGGHVVTVG